jgi:hypothetical protein
VADKVGGVEFDVTVDPTGAAVGASKVVDSNQKIDSSFKRIDKTSANTSKTIVKGNNSAAKAAQNLSRSIGMGGVQIGQFAGQIQGGQNALLAFSQQGTDIGMLFGPAGMIAGGIFAVGAAIAATLIPSLTDAKDSTEELEKAMESLRKVVKRGEGGIYDFTESVKELSIIGKSVITAELEASLIRAQKATKSAVKGITEAIDELDVDYGFSGIKTYVDAINNVKKSTNVSIESSKGFAEITEELGVLFGKTGKEARAVGAEIIDALASLEKTPSAKGAEKLQLKLSDLVTSGKDVSESAKLMVSDLKLFFAEARAAGETAEFLTGQLKKLKTVGSVDLDIEDVATQLTAAQELTQGLSQQLQISRAELAGNAIEANELAAAFKIGLEDASKLPQPIKDLLTELRLVGEQQDLNSEAEKAAMVERANLEKQLSGVEGSNAKDGGGSSELEKLTAKFEAERQIVLDHQAMLLEMKVDANTLTEEEQQRHADAITAINQREADAKASLTQKSEDAIRSMRNSAVQSAIGLLDIFAGKSKAAAIAAIILNKGLSLAQNAQNTFVAQTRALAELGPIAGPPVVASIGTYGALNAGLIAATGLGQIASIGSGSASSLTSSGGMPAQRTTGGDGGGGGTNVTVSGINPSDMFTGQQMMDTLRAIVGDGADVSFLGAG